MTLYHSWHPIYLKNSFEVPVCYPLPCGHPTYLKNGFEVPGHDSLPFWASQLPQKWF